MTVLSYGGTAAVVLCLVLGDGERRTRFTLGVLAFHLVLLATATLAALATGYRCRSPHSVARDDSP